MVIQFQLTRGRAGIAVIEIVLAMAMLSIAMLPLAYSVRSDAKEFRATCQRAVAMEIVDGEMEILAAGEWQYVPEGTHPYSIRAKSAAGLPPGSFQLTRAGHHLRLQWSATKNSGIGAIAREVIVK